MTMEKELIKAEDFTIGVISLGCPKNQVDLEIMLALLKDAHFRISTDINNCDIIIINTCGFIESAKQESIENILEFSNAKNFNNKLKLVIVTGCLAERYKDKILENIPDVDIVVGLGDNKNIVEIILNKLKGEKNFYSTLKEDMLIYGKRILTTPRYYAYLKIAEGCNNRCTYCAIPAIRGNYRSVPKEAVIEEAKWLAKNGVKELNIVAQDTTSYGIDIYNKLALPDLLKEICKIDGIEWVRILYGYPDKITEELIDVMATEGKIVKYIDIPFQHVNNSILKKMNRKGDKQLILDVISKLRNKIPDIVIRSTFIVGFPGETEEQFNELLNFIKITEIPRVGFFKYSKEEDTPAADFENQISEEVKERRLNLLMEEQDKILEKFNKHLKGKTLKVLVEGIHKGIYYGRSYMDAPDIDAKIEFLLEDNFNKIISPGEFVAVKI